MEIAPAGATTDSNMPTTNGSMNQIPNTDSGTSNPDSALPMATTKGEFSQSVNFNMHFVYSYSAKKESGKCASILL